MVDLIFTKKKQNVMLGSNNDFFKQDNATLKQKRDVLIYILKRVWKREKKIINFYLEAYDFFCLKPQEFDGATFVKDLCIMPDLDVFAMIHDYMYGNFSVSCNYKFKFFADKIYALEIERMGSSSQIAWTRFAGLTVLVGLFFTPYRFLIGLRMGLGDKMAMNRIYNNFKND
jgi:hypothetical protein